MSGGSELPACGVCGDDLGSPEHALEHFDQQHSMSGPAVVSKVLEWEWPENSENSEGGAR